MSLKIIRTTTLGTSLYTFCEGILSDLRKKGYEVVAISSPDSDFEALREREGVRTIAIPMERRSFQGSRCIVSLDSCLFQGETGYGTFHDTQSRSAVYDSFLVGQSPCASTYIYRACVPNG